MPAADATRVRLREIEAQLASRREERTEAQKAVEDAQEQYAGANSPGVDSDEFKAIEEKVATRGIAEEAYEKLQREQIGLLSAIGGSTPDASGQVRGGDGATTASSAVWSSANLFTDEVLEQLAYAAKHEKVKMHGIKLGEVLSAEGFATGASNHFVPEAAVPDVDPTTVMRRGPFRGIIPELRRPLSILDLIPTGTMEGNSFQYVREKSISGEGKPAAKTVKEGATKPQSAIEYVDAECVARTIAEYMKLKKQALADVPALRTAVDSRLRYFIERQLETEVLKGKGGGEEQLDGILHSSELGVVKYGATQDLYEVALKAIVTVLLANCRANGIALHPLDWSEALLKKAVQKAPTGETFVGDAQFYGGGPFGATPESLWGIPCIPSVAVPQGMVLVGDFQIGSTLLVREGIQVLLSDSDQDDFVKNRVTVLGEMRGAHALWRPEAYALGFLTKAAEEASR